jgi:signal transduction histidine kinase
MKDFSHPGSDQKEVIDINKAIESTLTVSHNEWKYNAELVTDFDAVLTAVPCYPGEFNQVILNMIVNASHAIADCRDGDSDELGTITIATRLDDGYAEVRISDTGAGMPEAVRKRIFEPFYTTKGVGKGSGQGLAIAYTVIVDKHGGTIEVDSEPDKGTTFIIRLPMRDSSSETETVNAEGSVHGQAV